MRLVKRTIKINNLILVFVSVLICSLCLTVCTSKIAKNAIEEGNLAIASMEYEKASGLFNLAINEGVKDEE